MVPMHAKKRKGAFQEAERRTPIRRDPSSPTRRIGVRRSAQRSMVPMRAKNDDGALDESPDYRSADFSPRAAVSREAEASGLKSALLNPRAACAQAAAGPP